MLEKTTLTKELLFSSAAWKNADKDAVIKVNMTTFTCDEYVQSEVFQPMHIQKRDADGVIFLMDKCDDIKYNIPITKSSLQNHSFLTSSPSDTKIYVYHNGKIMSLNGAQTCYSDVNGRIIQYDKAFNMSIMLIEPKKST